MTQFQPLRSFLLSLILTLLTLSGALPTGQTAAPAAATGLVAADTAPFGYLVGAYYFAGWWRDPPAHFQGEEGDWRLQFPGREPLTGWYDDSQAVVDREVAMAAEGGLDFFLFDWFPPRPDSSYPGATQNNNNGLHYYLSSPNKSLLRFALMYTNHAPFGITDSAEWTAAVDGWVEQFGDPQYQRVGGRPLFVVHDADSMRRQWGSARAVKAALDQLRERARAAGLPAPMIGGGVPQPGPKGAAVKTFASDGYDFYTGYSIPLARVAGQASDYASFAALQPPLWADFAQLSPLPYLPVVTAGWDKRPILDSDTPSFPDRSPAAFNALLQQARDAVDNQPRLRLPNTRPALLINAWNELGEGGYITPTKAEGDAYLNQVLEVFEPQPCSFTLGFAAIHGQLPDVVGRCVADETHDPLSGDAMQETTNGVLMWRKADNCIAFTDGSSTWVNGPSGLQNRPNDQRFDWEQGAQGCG
jgi:hypothetical protein